MAFDTAHRNGDKRAGKAWASTASATIALLLLTLIALMALRYSATAADDTASSVPGSTEQARYMAGKKRCEFFVLQKILSARQPVALDHWDIDGKRVFRVAFNMSGKGEQTERLCVYDLETRSALLPALGDQEQWLPGPPGAANG